MSILHITGRTKPKTNIPVSVVFEKRLCRCKKKKIISLHNTIAKKYDNSLDDANIYIKFQNSVVLCITLVTLSDGLKLM